MVYGGTTKCELISHLGRMDRIVESGFGKLVPGRCDMIVGIFAHS